MKSHPLRHAAIAAVVASASAASAMSAQAATPTGKIVGTAAPVVIMSIAGFMILEQLRIAPGVVLMTYGFVLGAVALGLALAFGLGGREVAGRMLNDMYDKAQANKGRVASDVRTGARRAQNKADDLRDQAS